MSAEKHDTTLPRKPIGTIFLSFDGSINQPRRDSADNMICTNDGNMEGGEPINRAKIQAMSQLAIELGVSLHINSGRPNRYNRTKPSVKIDIENWPHQTLTEEQWDAWDSWHEDAVDKLVAECGGYHDGVGGFNKNRNHLLGQEKYGSKEGRPHVYGLIEQKVDCLERIRKQYNIPLSNIIAFDASDWNIPLMREKGYTVHKTDPKSDAHLDIAIAFLKSLQEQQQLQRDPVGAHPSAFFSQPVAKDQLAAEAQQTPQHP